MGPFDPAELLAAEEPHKLVPREFDANLFYRRELAAWFEDEPANEQELVEACRRDVLFFVNAMVWTLDPKRFPGQPTRPWINHSFQDDLFLELEVSWGRPGVSAEHDQIGHDRCWVKSRDMGCSWIPLIGASRRFLLFDGQIFLFVSENEKLVDDRANPNALFPKIDLIHAKLPDFMLAGVRRNKLKFWREDSPSLLKGVSTTGIATAGGRPTAIIADEYGLWDVAESVGFIASSSGASASRLFLGTPKGQGNGFHKVAHNENIPRTDIHWTRHPWHREGLYQSNGPGGDVRFDDVEFWDNRRFGWLSRKYPLLSKKIVPRGGMSLTSDPFLRDCYEFVLDGKVRSPYYDNECLRTPFPWQVAQEHDLDFLGSGTPFYDATALNQYIERLAMVPILKGELSWDPYTFEPDDFQANETGRLMLWCNLTMRLGRLVPSSSHQHQIGVDVSAGTGASNSCISVWNCVTREKVARYMRRDVRPERFAEIAYAIGRWFGGAQIIFEGAGPGSSFGGRLVELQYPSVFRMTDRKGVQKPTPGLYYEGETKRLLLTDYGKSLMDGEATCRDREALTEGFAFQLGADSLIEHAESKVKSEPGGAKKNHGDAWMADTLAWFRVKKFRNLDRREVSLSADEQELERRLKAQEERRYAISRW